MKIVYMGTPDFAVFALKALAESEHEIVAVVTQPDQPKGRGHHMMPPPVKEYALIQNLPVFQPNSLKTQEFADQLALWAPDLIVVAAYGKILPKHVLDAPKYGCVNIHASILPRYRGAAPIQRALMNGDATVGVTMMQMAQGLDTGDMLSVLTTDVTEEDNFESVHDRLAALGAKGLLELLPQIENGTVKPQKQEESQATYAAKIEKSDCVVDFCTDAKTVAQKIRALSPVPLAFAYHNGTILKFTAAYAKETNSNQACGSVVALEKNAIAVACQSGTLYLTGVVPQGKGKMSAGDFIRGRKIQVGDRLTSAL